MSDDPRYDPHAFPDLGRRPARPGDPDHCIACGHGYPCAPHPQRSWRSWAAIGYPASLLAITLVIGLTRRLGLIVPELAGWVLGLWLASRPLRLVTSESPPVDVPGAYGPRSAPLLAPRLVGRGRQRAALLGSMVLAAGISLSLPGRARLGWLAVALVAAFLAERRGRRP